MGRHAHFYLGPYVVCKIEATTRTINVQACPSTTCSKPKPKGQWESPHTPFCSSCGTAIGPIDITIQSKPSPFEGLPTERLFNLDSDDGYYYFGVNEGKAYPRRFSLEEPHHEDLGLVDIAGEVVWFTARYAAEIAGLREVHADVRVTWGAHCFSF